MSKPNVLSEAIVMVAIKDLHPYKKNPRKGDIAGIAESLEATGQYRSIIVQKSTGDILAGNHTTKAAISLGWKEIAVTYIDVDDETAKKIVLADNRLNDTASYDVDILTELLGSIPDVVGTGYTSADVQKMLAAQMDQDSALIRSVIQPKVIEFEKTDNTDWDLTTQVNKAKDRGVEKFGEDAAGPVDNALNAYLEKSPSKFDDPEKLRTAYAVADIQKQLERLEQMSFIGQNYWGIPDLRRDMLVDTLPSDLKTWGGKDATPDDGISNYIWNYGLAASSGLPWDRAIMATFTYDSKFDSLLAEPAFQLAKLMHNGLTRAVAIDSSTYTDDSRITQLSSIQNSNWMTRFMQEAGIKVIPRFSWSDVESLKYALLGIPLNPPVVAISMQTMTPEEIEKNQYALALRMAVKTIQPECIIAYGAPNTTRKIVEAAVLPKSVHVEYVENYAGVRRSVVFDRQEGKALVDQHQRALRKEAKERDGELRTDEAEELSEGTD